MKKQTLLLSGLMLLAFLLSAQQRYLDPVFDEVQATEDLLYSRNATLLFYNIMNDAIPQNLLLDLYEPINDMETARPLVILLHNGYLLPPQTVDGCVGTKQDATVVELATSLATMGYVVAVPDYRLGWLPVTADPQVRMFSLMNALYRGSQDAKTCVRFFKRTVGEDNNPYAIDPTKIAVMGLGVGGYLAYLATTLDTITDTHITKLTLPLYGPMLKEEISGNVDGTSLGIVPVGEQSYFTPLDTLCYPNHVGYSSDFQLGMAVEGILLDTSFIEADDPPMIGMHFPSDAVTMCGKGNLGLNVPVPLLPFAIEVFGPCVAQPIFNASGANAVIDHPFTDPVSIQSGNFGAGMMPGFYPFLGEEPNGNYSPWQYASNSNPYNTPGANCDTNSARGKLYLDTILQYFAPRACLALDLGCNLAGYSPTGEGQGSDVPTISIHPNPAGSVLHFSTTADAPIQRILIYDWQGRLSRVFDNMGAGQDVVQLDGLSAGSYVVKAVTRKGAAARVVVVW